MNLADATDAVMCLGGNLSVDRPAERREMICAFESAEMAFMAVVVENKGLFGFVCPAMNFQMCRVIAATSFRPIARLLVE